MIKTSLAQWPFQEPKLEVLTIYKAYGSSLCKGISPQNMAKHMVLTYLHFRILEFPLISCRVTRPSRSFPQLTRLLAPRAPSAPGAPEVSSPFPGRCACLQRRRGEGGIGALKNPWNLENQRKICRSIW